MGRRVEVGCRVTVIAWGKLTMQLRGGKRMGFNTALNTIMENYPAESKKNFRGNSIGNLIRNEAPNIIRNLVSNDEIFS